jgi:L-iditol 2-dehydrogenase
MTCRECRAGRYNLCPNVRFFATPPIDGVFANYVTIHEDFAYSLPDNLSDNAGALMEPLSVGIWACRKASVKAGDHVLVTGAGPIGLLAMQVAVAVGATEVTITDVSPQRLEMAEKTGATRAINVSEEPLAEADVEVDALIECSGNRAALNDGIRCIRPPAPPSWSGWVPARSRAFRCRSSRTVRSGWPALSDTRTRTWLRSSWRPQGAWTWTRS